MNRAIFSRLAFIAVLIGIGFVPACNKEHPFASVSGKVTVDGKPLSGGNVNFIPDVPTDKEGHPKVSGLDTSGLSSGQIDPDGSYKIYTGGKAGAPVGKYKVTVTPPMVPAHGSTEAPPLGFEKKFSDAQQTPLHKEVVVSAKPGDYDLKLTGEKK